MAGPAGCCLAVINDRAHLARASVSWHASACILRRANVLAVCFLVTAALVKAAVIDLFAVEAIPLVPRHA